MMGVVANAVTSAMTTNMVNVRVDKIFACRPMFKTMSSTRPLEAINTPIVGDSRQTSPLSRAPIVPPKILDTNATTMMAIT